MRLGRPGNVRAAVRGMQRRQLVSLGAVIALMVVLGLTSGLELHQVQGVTSRVGTKRVPAVQLLANVDADIRAYREVQLEHVLAKNSEAQNPLEARMHASRAAVESELVRYGRFAARGEERQLLTSLREAWSRYVWQANDFLIPSRNQDVETARGYLNGVAHASFVAISANLSALRAANDRAVLHDVKNSRSTTSFGLVLNLVLLGIAALVAIGSQVAIFIQNLRTERFRSLVQRSSDLTLVCDPGGHIGYASSAAADMLGETEHTLLGREVVELIDEQHRVAVAQLFADHATGTAPSVECQIAHADGSIRWVELTGTDLTRDPAVKGVVLRLRDITVRRHLEIELRHAQKLESVGQLAAGIAHEINTPLQFIGDNVRFLTDAFTDLATLMPVPGPATPTDRTGLPGIHRSRRTWIWRS
jgi:PAS domain S-box-containing protein